MSSAHVTKYRHSGLRQEQYQEALAKLLRLIGRQRKLGRMNGFYNDCLTYARKECLTQKQYEAVIRSFDREFPAKATGAAS